MKIEEEFEKLYGMQAEGTAFTPYRVCPLGAHVDHNLGIITGFAIDKGIHIAYEADESGRIEVSSLGFDGVKSWSINDVPETKQGDWADHLRGATIALGRRYPLTTGLKGVLKGELPVGGLSSSAAVILSFLTALCRVNGITTESGELIDISREAENRYVGVNCGKLDQSCEILCRKDHLLRMDMKDGKYELIPRNEQCGDFGIAVFFSGLERSLAGSKYNTRVDEARSAACVLLDAARMAHGRADETNLRDVPYQVYLQYRNRLDEVQAKRAEHFFSECERAEKGAACWRSGDIEGFGKLVSESGKSSVEKWETGSPELIKLSEIMWQTDGIYGGRFSGAGFKGCCMAIINPKKSGEILAEVERKYLDAFPALRDKYTACVCETADGVMGNENRI